MTEPNVPEEKDAGRLRQFIRLLISYNDFKHARRIADHIVTLDPDAEYREGRWFLLQALNAAMIVAYSRPFSGSDKHTRPRVPDLPLGFLQCLNEEERKIHDVVLSDRNSVVAHSDSDAWDLRPVVLALRDHKVLMPWSNDTRAPLMRGAIATLSSAAGKLMEAVYAERMKWEPELMQYFLHMSPEEIEKDPFKALYGKNESGTVES